MGTVYKKTYTKPVPLDAELFTRKGDRHARWRTASGKRRTAEVTRGEDGSQRVILEAGTYTAKYRDGSGRVVERSTGCRDEAAARAVLAELEKRAEQVRSGIITPAQEEVAEHQDVPLSEHFGAYLAHLRAKGVSDVYRANAEHNLQRISEECEFARLRDMRRSAMERWMAQRAADGMGARTRNAHRAAIVAFGNWCVATHRLSLNPFEKLPRANEQADRRHQRRALTEDELTRLLAVAQQRPLLEARTIRRGPRKGQPVANVRPEVRRRLERLGRERALIYKTLVLTGLRKGELASLTVGQLDLDGELPCALLGPADAKNKRAARIPLRPDLAEDLRKWLHQKLEVLRDESREAHRPVPMHLPLDTPLFRVPRALSRILERDLALAGIPKGDRRGRVVDVHSLRHTFGTHLSKAGVSPRTAQAAMRHSSIQLTMNTYTDPELLDVRGALNALPDLPLGSTKRGVQERATGTDGGGALAPMLAPNPGDSCILQSIGGNTAREGTEEADSPRMAQKAARRSLDATEGCEELERVMGFEPTTPSMAS